MCSRYEIGDRVQRFLIPYGWNQQLRAGDVHPQEKAPVLTRDSGRISACPMAWGMTHPNTGKLIINAREETAAEKPMFSRSLRTQRCILPAEKFYEWDADKHKITFSAADNGLLYLCGIYRFEDTIPHFVILTKAADDVMRPVHDRMSAMIREKDIDEWLLDDRRVQDLLKSDVRLVRHQPVEEFSLF